MRKTGLTKTVGLWGPTVVLVLGCAASAYAVDSSAVGGAEINLLKSLLTGSLGLFVGLVTVLVGVWNFIKGNTSSGIILAVLGVVFTLLPTFYNGVTLVVCPIANALSSGSSCQSAPL